METGGNFSGLLWVGVIPFIALFLTILLTKRGLLAASALFLFITAVIAMLVWQVDPAVELGAILKGAGVSLDIVLIVLGSLFFLDVMRKIRVISSLEHYLHTIAPDSRIQAIILVWFFGALLEGTAGFDTPAAVVAPLLVSLGIAAIPAAVITLLGNTVPVAFGALGTPMRIGLGGILERTDLIPWIITIGCILSFVVPVLLTQVIHREVTVPTLANRTRRTKPSSILPFALWAGGAFALPYAITSLSGVYLPSIGGSIGGLVLTSIASKVPAWRRIFIPKHTLVLKERDPNHVPLHLWRVILPYALMILLVILGTTYLPTLTFSLPGNLSQSYSLAHPGIIFIIVGFIFAFHGRLTIRELGHTLHDISGRIIRTASIVLCVVAATQIMAYSDQNSLGLPSMLMGIQSIINRDNLIIISPLIGALGSFVAGSVTVSNLVFGELQWQAAVLAGGSGALVAALQVYGATAGNAIALSSVSMLEGTLKLPRGSGKKILYKLAAPLGIYLSVLVLIAIIATILLKSNCGTVITGCSIF